MTDFFVIDDHGREISGVCTEDQADRIAAKGARLTGRAFAIMTRSEAAAAGVIDQHGRPIQEI